jgi:hypothetical protein
MMAGADEPATLSGFCQPMAMAMVSVLKSSIQGLEVSRAKDSESARLWWRLKGLRDQRGDIGRFRVGNIRWQVATGLVDGLSVILALGTGYLGW